MKEVVTEEAVWVCIVITTPVKHYAALGRMPVADLCYFRAM